MTEACRKAHVGRGTFYYWKPRFDEYGYTGLETFASRAPKEHYQTPVKVEDKVLALRREHPDGGKKRIADELTKANNWVPLVSPNTVRRILEDAGLWQATEAGEGEKGGSASPSDSRTARARASMSTCASYLRHTK